MPKKKNNWNGLDELEPPDDDKFWKGYDGPSEDDYELHYDYGDYEQESWHRNFSSTGSVSLDPDWFD